MGGRKKKNPVPDYGTRVKTRFTSWCHPHSVPRYPLCLLLREGDRIRLRTCSDAVFPRSCHVRASSLMARFSVRRCTGYSCVLAAVHTLGIISVISRFVKGGVWAEGSRPSGEGRPGKAGLSEHFLGISGVHYVPPVQIPRARPWDQHFGGADIGGDGDVVLVTQAADIMEVLLIGPDSRGR